MDLNPIYPRLLSGDINIKGGQNFAIMDKCILKRFTESPTLILLFCRHHTLIIL